MLREAELFVMAEQMLVEVVGRVRPQDEEIVLPPMFPGAAAPTPVRRAVEQYVRDDLALTSAITGSPAAGASGVDEASQDACAAAAQAENGRDVVQTGDGGLPVRELLLQATLARSLLAHYLAAYLGSTACPLPEELARPLWELTAPEADRWRALGWFRDPMPLPDHVSWRDRFLLDAGHLPHPLGH
jgi:hypothetical protein